MDMGGPSRAEWLVTVSTNMHSLSGYLSILIERIQKLTKSAVYRFILSDM